MTAVVAYVVTLHDGGGSMVEAADAEFAFGLFAERDRAIKAADRLMTSVSKISDVHRSEWWTTIQAVRLPDATPGKTWYGLADDLVTAEIDRITEEVKASWDS